MAITLLVGGCTTSTAHGGGRPAPSGTPAASGSGQTVTVHLDVLHQGQATLALVPVKVSGKGPYAFVLDTGASVSGITASLATKLGLRKTGKSSEVSGVAASARVPLVSVRQWSVGGTPLRPGTIGALNFPRAGGSSKGTPTIAGLLGSDQLSRFGSVTIDYARQELRFTPGAR